MRHSFYFLLLLGAATMLPLSAKDKKAKADPKDAIQVVGHIPLTGAPVKQFFTTRHYSNAYLYAEHEAGRNVTLIDVSKAAKPRVLAEVAYGGSGEEGLSLVAGTAALVASEATAAPAAPQNVKIMDFSDPANPKVAREFAGVTAMTRDDGRGLIFFANADGIWILQQRLAEDPEVERAYAYQVVYGMSMYPPR